MFEQSRPASIGGEALLFLDVMVRSDLMELKQWVCETASAQDACGVADEEMGSCRLPRP